MPRSNVKLKWYYHPKGPFARYLEPSDIPDWAVGFVYCIEDMMTGKIYIGKKLLHSTRKVRMSQKERTELGTKKVFKIVKKPSGWEDYLSSCIPLKQEIAKRPKDFKKTILKWAFSKKNLTYLEMKYQFNMNVLEIDSYNENIGAKLFKQDAIGPQN